MDTSKTILFAEPGEAASRALGPLLTDRGYEPVLAKTLKETLLTLQALRVDALVLDASLLEEDTDFISVIKGMERDLPIIVCSEINTPELERRIRKHGIFYYHIRSFGIQDLEMAVSNAINGLPR